MRKRQIRHQKYAYRQKDGYRFEQVGVPYILMQTANRDSIRSNRGDVADTKKHEIQSYRSIVATHINRYKIKIKYSIPQMRNT